jgi:hypothetical protein
VPGGHNSTDGIVSGSGIRVSPSSRNRDLSERSSRTGVNRRHYRPPAARRPTGESSCRSMTTGQSFRRHPTSCPRSTSTAYDPSRARGVNGAVRRPDSERLRAQTGKPPLRSGKAGVPASDFLGSGTPGTQLKSRSSVRERSPKCHWPGYPSVGGGCDADACVAAGSGSGSPDG